MKQQQEHILREDGLTVIVHRTIKPGRESEFETAMRQFVQFALGFPGHRGIHVIRPGSTVGAYTVVDRFTDAESRHAFTSTPEYAEWMKRLGELTEGTPDIQELSGLEGWFSRPGAPLQTPPRYKMALVTFIGVCLVIAFLNLVLSPFIGNWPYFPNLLIFNACVVTLLTWVVMPVLTRIMRGWLFKKPGDHSATTL